MDFQITALSLTSHSLINHNLCLLVKKKSIFRNKTKNWQFQNSEELFTSVKNDFFFLEKTLQVPIKSIFCIKITFCNWQLNLCFENNKQVSCLYHSSPSLVEIFVLEHFNWGNYVNYLPDAFNSQPYILSNAPVIRK